MAVAGIPSKEVYFITGDQAGNIWLSGKSGLLHLVQERVLENVPWSAFGRSQQAKVVVPDRGGVWMGFWDHGGVLYFNDGKIRASYTTAVEQRKGHVGGLRLDREGAVWAATQDGGLSRIKDGHIYTMTMKYGLPCDTIQNPIRKERNCVVGSSLRDLFETSVSDVLCCLCSPYA